MSDKDLVAEIDQTAVDEVEKLVRNTAQLICAEQPDVPEPQSLADLDSFSMVQVLLELENELSMTLLDRFEGFAGESFRDLAEFIVRLRDEDERGGDEATPGQGVLAEGARSEGAPGETTTRPVESNAG
jgi:acyl carrier protein